MNLEPKDIDQLAPGRDLDGIIGAAFFNYVLCSGYGGKHSAVVEAGKPLWPVPDYSTTMGAAWLLVEQLERTAQLVDITRAKDFDRGIYVYECEIWNTSGAPDSSSRADTAPLAICRAALKARLDLLDAVPHLAPAAPLPL